MLCSDTCYVIMVVDILWPAKCWSVLCITKWVCKFLKLVSIDAPTGVGPPPPDTKLHNKVLGKLSIT